MKNILLTLLIISLAGIATVKAAHEDNMKRAHRSAGFFQRCYQYFQQETPSQQTGRGVTTALAGQGVAALGKVSEVFVVELSGYGLAGMGMYSLFNAYMDMQWGRTNPSRRVNIFNYAIPEGAIVAGEFILGAAAIVGSFYFLPAGIVDNCIIAWAIGSIAGFRPTPPTYAGQRRRR